MSALRCPILGRPFPIWPQAERKRYRNLPDHSPKEPDQATLTRLADGDITALATVFELFGERIYRLCRRMMGNAADAEDGTQEIFLRAFNQAKKFDGRSRFSTWFYRLAVRHCLNKLKQRDRRMTFERWASERGQPDPPALTPSPLESLTVREDIETLNRLLQSLKPNYRACLVLREIEGLSYAQIAEVLALPVGTVMSRLSRARDGLRAKLKKIRDDELRPGNNLPGPAVKRMMEERSDDLL